MESTKTKQNHSTPKAQKMEQQFTIIIPRIRYCTVLFLWLLRENHLLFPFATTSGPSICLKKCMFPTSYKDIILLYPAVNVWSGLELGVSISPTKNEEPFFELRIELPNHTHWLDSFFRCFWLFLP